ncbi:unnamed protein product [Prunus armeniaca]|uniref:EF-hand domain-containing protein n=1 Tax=Prunus armeniaca TaxID=36596 RepID=A0A6J5TL55_PRUAR|nr:unnamed protein product [Prunus armeniaca]
MEDIQNFLQPLVKFVSTRWKVWTKTQSLSSELPPTHEPLFGNNKAHDETELSREEVDMVMGRLGMCYEHEAEEDNIGERVGAEELWRLFDEEKPSLEEVKEAFDVFDENRDGFIDAAEVQRVLSNFGFKDAFGLDECQRMINAADMNQDGVIDFDEFVKHMENSFC